MLEQARQTAKQLGVANFKGTNTWLEKWKKCHNVKQMPICGESGDVQEQTFMSWKKRLPEILWGYKKEDIYNLDETGCFWRALPDCRFVKKGNAEEIKGVSRGLR